MARNEGDVRDSDLGRALADLPLPPEPANFFAELRERVREREARRHLLRALAVRRPIALLCATAVVFAAIGGAAGSIAASGSKKVASSPVLAFTPAAGWNTLQSRDAHDARVQFVWAANVPFSGKDSVTGEPIQTAKTLPPDGVVVYVSSLPSVPDASGYRDLGLPLRLSDGDLFTSGYENQPAPNVSKVMINAHVNGRYVYVEVLFGTQTPSAATRDAADAQLARLVVPVS